MRPAWTKPAASWTGPSAADRSDAPRGRVVFGALSCGNARVTGQAEGSQHVPVFSPAAAQPGSDQLMPETGVSSDRAARATSGQVTFSLRPLDDPAALEPLWINLERRAEPSFFRSWQGIANWLRTLPAGIRPWLLSLCDDGGTITGLALLTPRRVRRLGVLRIGQWWLHETGDPALDAPTIEDNGILLADETSAPAAPAATSHTLVPVTRPTLAT